MEQSYAWRARRVAIATVLGAAAFASTLPGAAADFVHTVKDDNGVWWFEHNGNRFLNFAANHVNNGGLDDGVGGRERAVCLAATNNSLCGDSLNFGGKLGYAPYHNVTVDKYGLNESVWAEASIARLQSWGFNGISGWSATIAEEAAVASGLYYFHLLDIGVTWPHAWSRGLDWDVWSANFSNQCETIAASQVPGRANDPYLIGWQTDNEINWAVVGLLTYLNEYATSEGGQQALSFLQGRYGTLAALNAAWGINAPSWATVGAHMHDSGYDQAAEEADDADFIGTVAEQYFAVSTAAIRKYDSNHMISGVRFAVNSVQIVTAAGKYCDIIDQHDYSDLPDMGWLAQVHNITGKPVVLGEYSFTAADSNMPNTVGARANNPAPTQTQRTRLYAAYATTLITSPFVIGYGWWNFVDEPSTGRWPDGEDSNYGLISLADDPYSLLTNKMTEIHAAAPAWHTQGWAPCPSPWTNTTTVPLYLYYSESRGDHFLTTTGGPGQDCYECYGLYTFMETVGYVYPECVDGAIPLPTYYSGANTDNALLAAQPALAGYSLARVEAYGLPPSALNTTAGVLPLYSTLITSPKADYWGVVGSAALANATSQGYADLGLIAAIFSQPVP